MNKKLLLLFPIMVALFILFFNPSINPGIKCGDCNVVLVSLDAVRADHLGCYGYFRNTSPNIDTLAKESALFKNSFSQSSLTPASHMSIFTSLHPFSHGVYLGGSLNPNTVTLAHVLNKNNYTTIWAGILDAPSLDLNRGFERGFDYFIDESEWKNNQTYYWEEGLKWIEENKNKRFFMFLHTYKTHDPYTPSPDTISEFTNRTNKKIIFSEEKLWGTTMNKIISDPSIVFKDSVIRENEHMFSNFSNESLWRDLYFSLCTNYSNLHRLCCEVYVKTFWENVNLSSDSDMDYIKLLYDSEIYETDRDVKRLVDTLKRENLMNRTVLIITADHGEEFMEHGNVGHSKTLYEEVIHVPLIIWIPGVNSKEVYSLVQGIDIMPTILSLIGINIPKQAQGVNLLPLIEGETMSLNEYVYGGALWDLSSIRSSNWKYITNFRDIGELYNLKEDPEEKENMIEKEKIVAERLTKKLYEVLGSKEIEEKTKSTNITEETIKKLKALGYIK